MTSAVCTTFLLLNSETEIAGEADLLLDEF